MIQDAWGWCTGMTQRDGMGREVGEGFKMGSRGVQRYLSQLLTCNRMQQMETIIGKTVALVEVELIV